MLALVTVTPYSGSDQDPPCPSRQPAPALPPCLSTYTRPGPPKTSSRTNLRHACAQLAAATGPVRAHGLVARAGRTRRHNARIADKSAATTEEASVIHGARSPTTPGITADTRTSSAKKSGLAWRMVPHRLNGTSTADTDEAQRESPHCSTPWCPVTQRVGIPPRAHRPGITIRFPRCPPDFADAE